ncbi:hypothetical protein L6164_006387 [Bauhinia variegata]|uniref:Uncharacterized protein n=1 Tax=Bauhinia variegata TaxID=167791 RepID=A0ACB9PU57_BAUVA|nr:hypothetical protein L6164_006387 [Bauhinia variegata]
MALILFASEYYHSRAVKYQAAIPAKFASKATSETFKSGTVVQEQTRKTPSGPSPIGNLHPPPQHKF